MSGDLDHCGDLRLFVCACCEVGADGGADCFGTCEWVADADGEYGCDGDRDAAAGVAGGSA
jgi:hypothetical protein